MNPGSRIGPYEVVSSIGAGGMGEVFRARDTKLSRDVAIKILPAAFAKDHDRVARFKREAQILASLQHPNIAGIYGLEEDSAAGILALAMEFVDGEDLAARLRRGAVPSEDALAIAGQIAAGLEEAHEHGIVHRDLKPANVKVTPEGKVKVLDFGLAKALDSAPGSAPDVSAVANSPTMTHHQTTGGMIVGTAPYMSPEQARGRKVDKRSDIWSFGVLLFEMLTGARLFRGETVSDTLAAVLREEIPWPSLPADVPPGARHLLRRCLERDPSKRLRDIGEARLLLAGDATTLMTLAGPTASTSRRDLLRLGLAGAAGVAGGVLLRSAWPTGEVRVEREGLASRALTESGTVISVSISPDGKFIAYVESEQGQQSLWLQQIESAQTLRLIPERVVGYWGHVFAPDGNAIIFGLKSREQPKGALFSIPTLGGTPRRIIGDIDSPPTFSPDGRRMAFSRQGFPDATMTSIIVAGVDGSEEKTLATFKEPERVAGIFFGGPAWSKDGASIATVVGRTAQNGVEPRSWLVSIAVADGRVTKLADPGWDRAAQCEFLPDGRSLLVIAATPTQREAQLWKVRLPGGEAYAVTSDTDDHRIVSLTQDGKKLATVVGDIASTASLMSVDDPSRLRRIGRGRLEGIGGGALTKDRAVFGTQVGGDWAITSIALDGSLRETLYKGAADERIASVVTTREGDVFFNVRSGRGREVRRIRAGAQGAERIAESRDEIAVSRDGRYLFYTMGTPAGLRLVRHDLQSNETKVMVDAVAYLPAVDAAGERVAFYMNTEKGFRLGMCGIDGGPLLFEVPAEAVTPGTASLGLGRKDIYTNTVTGDRANVWAIPTGGGAPRRVTAFADQILFDFAMSEDEKTLLVVRGPRIRDAHLVTGF
jgi:tRNA A-37 threonylcarbamoyl transferase component Bud32